MSTATTNLIPDEAAYIAARPKLKAAIDALHASATELAELDATAGRASANYTATYQRCLEAVRSLHARLGVERYADLSVEGKAESDAQWTDLEAILEAEKAARDARQAAFERLHALFVAAEDEAPDVARAFRTCGWRGWSLDDTMEAASHIALKALLAETRAAFFARPKVGIADVRPGMTVFLPSPCEVRTVLRLTPGGQIVAKSLHTGAERRFTVRSWPDDARRVTRAMAKDALALSAEWKRRTEKKGAVA